jgi:hypothetical protein
MEDGGFSVIRISRLQGSHFLLVNLRVSVFVLSVLPIDFSQRVNVALFAGRGLGIGARDVVLSAPRIPPGSHVAVMPQTVLMRLVNATLRHRTGRFLSGDSAEGAT